MKKARNAKALAYSRLKMLEHEVGVAWASRNLDKCLELLGKVVIQNPRSANAYMQMARVHGIRCEYDDARECLEKAVKVSPREQRALALMEAGRACRDFYDPGFSESYLRRALEAADAATGRHRDDDRADARLALAEHLIRTRDRSSAESLVDEVLGVDPQDKKALFLWCQLHEDQVELVVGRLQKLMEIQDFELRTRAGYQLAKVLDRAGDYDGAMDALVSSKSSMMGARDPIVTHRIKLRRQVRQLVEDFTDEKLSEWAEVAQEFGRSKKLAMLLGHPRSGTTLLEQVLDSNSGLISSEESENFAVHFYCAVTNRNPPLGNLTEMMDRLCPSELVAYRERYLEGMERSLMEGIGDRVLLDKNPSLTPLAPLFFRLFPEVKFVAMLRDPRDIVVSCFMQPFFPPDVVTGNFLTLADSATEVAYMMDSWCLLRERFGARVCEVRYENMVEDLDTHARRVTGFLGLEWEKQMVEFDRYASKKVVRSPTAQAVTEKLHKRAVFRWRNYEKYFGRAIEILRPTIEALGYD